MSEPAPAPGVPSPTEAAAGARLRRPASGLPEPPPFRAHPLSPAGLCVNCGTAVGGGRSAPRCWECGRALCADCYWHHGLSPTDHRCTGCAGRGPPPSASISGGRLSPV